MNAAPAMGLKLILTGYAAWLIVPLAVLLALLIARLYLRETLAFGKRGFWLRMLRVGVVVTLTLLLSQPIIQRVTAKTEPPVVVVLRDRSASMFVHDKHEPAEKKIRTAIMLGWLDAGLRDVKASQAASELNAAQNTAEVTLGGVRQALQQLQESGASADRVSEVKRNLGTVSAAVQRAGGFLASAPLDGPQLGTLATKCAETAQCLQKDFGDTPTGASDARRYLLDKSQSVKMLKQDLTKLAVSAQQLQDRVDRALAESGKPAVKAALDRFDKTDRFTLLKQVLEKAAGPSSGEQCRVVAYDIDTDLRSPDREHPDDEKTAATVPARGRKGALPPDDAKAEKPDERSAFTSDLRNSDTDLATPLLRLAERHAQDTIAAVVLCSDGRHTTGPSPEDAARAMAARGTPVHTLGVGSIEPPPDICVARLDGTLSVFLEETIRLTAHIKTVGCKGKKCDLVLSRGEKELQRRAITISQDGWLHQPFDLTADLAGPNAFTASIVPLPDETLTTNNSASAVVDVANDKLKVLVVDEMPRWEMRYVASMLRRERKMNLTERWLTTTEVLNPRAKALPDEQKSLEEYDIIVLGDLAAERLDDATQKRLAKYVADAGGFLVVIAGPRAMPRAYATGPLADLLPIRQQMPLGVGATIGLPGSIEPAATRVKLAEGSHSEIVRVLRDPALNEQLWPALPELPWIARPAFAKPGATTLLCADDARKDAVVAIHNYGAGRVLYCGSDNTWRWRYKVGDRVHTVFWAQAVRWGVSNRLAGSERLKAGVDRREIRPGDNLEVIARPRDKEGHAVTGATVIAELGDRSRPQRVQLQPVADSGGLYRGTLQNLGAGVHSVAVTVSSPDFEGIVTELQVIARELTGQEGVELSRDASRLTTIAGAGSGRYADLLDAPQLFKDLAGQSRQRTVEDTFEMWSSYYALIFVVLLLVTEWLLRKRLGLV
ncbi:MAG TPA: hypothetical protein VGP72_30570 [Planctomycetota bacterium]|jgi:hypothetical protein